MKVAVAVGVRVEVFVAVTLGVDVTVAIAEAVDVGVTVAVGVRLRVAVAVAVLVDVEVAVGALWISTTNCGGVPPSRDEKVTPSVPSATKANVYVPLPVIREVTLYSTQEFVLIAPLLSNAPLNRAGRVFQVIPPVPDSIQLLSAR